MRGLGWLPELPDARDAKYALKKVGAIAALALPRSVDLRPKCPPIVDQGQTSSCVGNAIAGLLDFLHPDTHASGIFMPSSRRFIYWGANVIEGTQGQDNGVYIRDGMKVVAQGVPHELACRFSEAKIATMPAKVAFTQASRRRKIASYHPLSTVDQMRACLAEGFPFVFGFTVYDYFMSEDMARSGDLSLPDLSVERPQGGHAVVAVGYDDDAKRFIVRNSWGEGWSPMRGYFTMPYAYAANRNLADDFWTARL